MTGVKATFDTSEVVAGLRRLADRGGDLSPALRSFGEHLLRSHRRRFTPQVSPDGEPWAPLSPAYRATKKRNVDKVLVLRGYLQGTIRYQVDANTLLFGTNRVYAAVQQFGARKGEFGSTSRGAPIPWGDIPARPHVGLSDDDVQEGMRIIRDYLASAI